MTIRFHCANCTKRLKVEDRHAGKRVKCPKCGASTRVPAEPTGTQEIALRAADIQREEEEGETSLNFKKKVAQEDDMDMTPMVDMVFLLLIFFMVTAAFNLQKSIEMPQPDQTESVAQTRTIEEIEEDDDYVIVRIEKDNTIWVEDSVAYTEVELLSRLRQLRQGESGSKGPTSLLVMASGDAEHQRVVMALDAGTAVGMENIRLADLSDEDF